MDHTVLCIEDDQDHSELMRLLLLRRPHTTVCLATNAHDGIQAATDERPALVLLDNRLPDATAHEVLHRLAASLTTAAIPVIVVSADSASSVMNGLVTSGAADFLTKPHSASMNSWPWSIAISRPASGRSGKWFRDENSSDRG
jgi:CheY-like chemotaxis protein